MQGLEAREREVFKTQIIKANSYMKNFKRYGKIRVDANNLRNNESRPEIYPVG